MASKKRKKLMLTYVITIAVTVLIILIVGTIAMRKVNDRQRQSVMDLEVTSAEPKEYAPSVLDNQTTLFIIDAEDRSTASVFLLTRMIPVERRIVIVPLQSDMYTDANGMPSTLYEAYKSEGAAGAKRAAEAACDLVVEKYMTFDKAGFEKAAAHFDTVSYVFPYSLIYENEKTKEVTVIREGNTSLDPASIRKAITFPNFKNGETERCVVTGTIFTDMINYSVNRFKAGMDQAVEGILKCCKETDITSYDYEFKKEAMMYMTDNDNGIAETVLPSGQYDEFGRYVLDEDFVRSLKTWFSLDIFDTEAVPAGDGPDSLSEETTTGLLPTAYSADVMQ